MKLISFLFFTCCNLSHADSMVLREGDLPRLVFEGNALVKSEVKKVESFKELDGHLGRSFLPQLSLLAGYEQFRYVKRDFGGQPYFGAEIELNIYNGGQDSLKSQMNELSLDKGKAVQKIGAYSQLELARKTFWTAVFLKNLVTQYETALKIVQKNKNEALNRVRAGVATRSDQFQFDIKKTELRQDKKSALLNLEKETSRLKVLLGLDQERAVVLGEQLSHSHDWKELLNHSEADHNYLVAPQEFTIKESELKAKMARASWYPRLDAYALWLQKNQRSEFDLSSSEERQQTVFGLRATWNISNVYLARAQSKSQKANKQSNSYKLDYQKRELQRELHLELRELELLDGMVHDAELNIDRSRKFFKMIVLEYKRGVKSSGDMLSAAEKLMASEIRIMKIIRDFHLARAHVMTKLGK